jgi:uncharacterized membrane protein
MNYFAHGYGMEEWGHGYGDIGWGWLYMVLMMAVVILGAVLLVRFLVNDGSKTRQDNDAMETLKQRYAKGEISKK